MTIYERVQRIRKAVENQTQTSSAATSQLGDKRTALCGPFGKLPQDAIAKWNNGWRNFSNWSGNFNKGT